MLETKVASVRLYFVKGVEKHKSGWNCVYVGLKAAEIPVGASIIPNAMVSMHFLLGLQHRILCLIDIWCTLVAGCVNYARETGAKRESERGRKEVNKKDRQKGKKRERKRERERKKQKERFDRMGLKEANVAVSMAQMVSSLTPSIPSMQSSLMPRSSPFPAPAWQVTNIACTHDTLQTPGDPCFVQLHIAKAMSVVVDVGLLSGKTVSVEARWDEPEATSSDSFGSWKGPASRCRWRAAGGEADRTGGQA